MRRLLLSLVLLLALALPSTAVAKVSVVGVTSPARPGANATLVVAVSPAAACSIVVSYKSGPSKAKGLVTKRAVAGRVSWTWKVGTNTTPGRWPIDVSCGAAGKLRTWLVVRR